MKTWILSSVLSTALCVMACEKKNEGGKPGPGKPGFSLQTEKQAKLSDGGYDFGSVRGGTAQRVAFAFENEKESDFSFSISSKSVSCSGLPPVISFALRGEDVSENGAALAEGEKRRLAPGRHVFVMEARFEASCDVARIGFSAALSAVSSGNSAPTVEPTRRPSTPQEEEQNRRARGELLDETTIEVVGRLSTREGCQTLKRIRLGDHRAWPSLRATDSESGFVASYGLRETLDIGKGALYNGMSFLYFMTDEGLGGPSRADLRNRILDGGVVRVTTFPECTVGDNAALKVYAVNGEPLEDVLVIGAQDTLSFDGARPFEVSYAYSDRVAVWDAHFGIVAESLLQYWPTRIRWRLAADEHFLTPWREIERYALTDIYLRLEDKTELARVLEVQRGGRRKLNFILDATDHAQRVSVPSIYSFDLSAVCANDRGRATRRFVDLTTLGRACYELLPSHLLF